MRIILILILFVKTAHAGFFMEPGLSMGFGKSDFNENNGTFDINHRHYSISVSYDLSLKLGFQAGSIGLAAIGFYQREANHMGYYPINSGTVGAADYHQTLDRQAAGYNLLIGNQSANAMISLEYFPYARTEIVWANQAVENPFTKGDKQFGKGYGFGVIAMSKEGLGFHLMYRTFSYNKVSLAGIEYEVPNTRFYKNMDSSCIHGGASLRF